MAKIMVVDDSNIVAKIVSSHLVKWGHEVHVANSPFGVSNKVREIQPDIVLMDLGLPGLSGNKLLEMIHGLSKTRIIIFSSANEETMKELVKKGNADDYFVKGGNIELLEMKIMTQLGRAAVGSTNSEFSEAKLNLSNSNW